MDDRRPLLRLAKKNREISGIWKTIWPDWLSRVAKGASMSQSERAEFEPIPPFQGDVRYILLLTLVATLGGLLFGYDTAVIAGAIDYMVEKFSLSATMKGWVTSNILLGCAAGAILAGPLSDLLGRRRLLLITAVLFAVSAIGTAIPANLTQFVFFRILGGLAVGAAALVAPIYVAEIARLICEADWSLYNRSPLFREWWLSPSSIGSLLCREITLGMSTGDGDGCLARRHCRLSSFCFAWDLCRKVRGGLSSKDGPTRR